jgi:hypothetical protein
MKLSENKMSTSKSRHVNMNKDIKLFGLALVGASLAYIFAAILMYFFMDFYWAFAHKKIKNTD